MSALNTSPQSTIPQSPPTATPWSMNTAEQTVTPAITDHHTPAPWLSIDVAVQQVHQHRAAGQSIVVANGCFDCLHVGHLQLLKFAKQQGDILLVAVNSDASVQRLKGPTRPIFTLNDRITMLAACRWVDLIVSFETDTPEDLLAELKPHLLVKGADYRQQDLAGAEYCGRVAFAPIAEGFSTTCLVERIHGRVNATMVCHES